MQGNKIENSQRTAVLAGAMTVPLIQAAGYSSWLTVLTVGGASLVLGWYLGKWLEPVGPWLGVMQNLWICVVLSQMLRWCGQLWPGHRDGWAAPILVLALAVWLTRGKDNRMARAGAALALPVLLGLGLVILSGAADVDPEQLMPKWRMGNWDLVWVLLLFPLCMGDLRDGGGKGMGWALTLGTAASAVIAGVLSPGAAVGEAAPLYEMSRTVTLFGVADRFESLTAAAMTVGYFVAVSYLLEYTKRSDTGRRTWVYGLGAALLFLLDIEVEGRWIALGTAVLWIVLPVLGRGKNYGRK